MKLSVNDLMPRVERGMAWLDAQKPGWEHEVDLGRLDIGQCGRCIGGQLFVRDAAEEDGYYELCGLMPDPFDRKAHGFTMLDDTLGNGYERLTECWVTVILERRFKEQSQSVETPQEQPAVAARG